MNISIENFCSMIEPEENKEYFDIPTIQRGFVWKPYQIENLWDSLARNFPIGTFIIDDTASNKQILDGQQRASAIAIGCKGIKSNSLFNLKDNFMRLFIDIAKPDLETDKKFTFKLITRSHPWGYQLNDNDETLTVTDRSNALAIYDELGITKNSKDKNEYKYFEVEDKRTEFFPYDCYLPIPVELFLQAKDKKECINTISTYIKNSIFNEFIEVQDNIIQIKYIPFLDFYKREVNENNKIIITQKIKVPTKGLLSKYEKIYQTYKRKFTNKKIDPSLDEKINSDFIKVNEKISFYSLDELYDKIAAIKKYQLVFSNLTNSELNINGISPENDNERVLDKDEQTSDIETIFQRLNRGGTPISEDDLTFSLFKSSLGTTNEAKDLLDNFIINCEGLINPSRMFRLAYLLWEQSNKYAKENSKQYELAYQRIKYKVAKNDFKEQSFKDFLTNHFVDDCKKNYFKKFKEIFLYSNENKNGLPYPLFIQLCKSAPELVFLMMYRLNIIGDYEKVKNHSKNRNLMIGFLLGLYWFFKGKKEKSYTPLLRTVWPLVSFATFKNCWSTELLQRCSLMYDTDKVDNYIFEDMILYNKDNGTKNTNIVFIDKILNNKDLVLYAQKDIVAKWFNNPNIFLLDDNSIPYDFDHICPSSYRNKRKFNKKIKQLLDDIGNYRVWPFDLNRSDQDKDIKTKFDFNKKNNIFEKYEITNRKMLFKYSLIKWENIDNYTIENLNKSKLEKERRDLYNDIQNRSKEIYDSWYKLVANIYDNDNKHNFWEKEDNEKIIDKINTEIKKNCKNVKIELDESLDEIILQNNSILVFLYDEKQKDYIEEKGFPFSVTLASYNSKDSFKHLCKEIIQTLDEYKEKKNKK